MNNSGRPELALTPRKGLWVIASPLAPSRSLRRFRRLDLRAVCGILLLLASTAGAIIFWTASSTTRDVLVATHNLPIGTILGASDLALVHVRVDDSIYQAAVPANALGQIVGEQLAEPVHAGQILIHAQVSNRPLFGPDQLLLSIPVSTQTAVGGQLRSGDAVEILFTTGKGTPDAKSSVVVPRVTVYDVGYDDATSTDPNTSDNAADGQTGLGKISSVTLVVTSDQALALVRAKWSGDLDLAMLAGG